MTSNRPGIVAEVAVEAAAVASWEAGGWRPGVGEPEWRIADG